MNKICKILLISLLTSNLTIVCETFIAKNNKNDNTQRVEVIIPGLEKKKNSTTTKFVKQIMRLAVAIAAYHYTSSENVETLKIFLEKHKNIIHESLYPGYEKIIDFTDLARIKLDDTIYKYIIKLLTGAISYKVTDVSWDDLVDFCKTPLYLLNSMKVTSAIAFYYVAFLYYKGLTPKGVIIDAELDRLLTTKNAGGNGP